jgi:diguanylate cyclase (GGDEF)-like protein/PAS domain S-box-containing protein
MALGKYESFIKTIADSLPGMVGYWDKDLRCRFANRSYLDWFGKPPEAIIGNSMQDLLGEALFSRNEPYIRAALKGERQQFERTLSKADGTVGQTLADYIPDIRNDGSVAGFFVLVSDVTRIKQAESNLKMAASVFDQTLEGIVVTDADQVVLSVNPAFTTITGYSPEEIIGKTPRILKSNRHDAAFYAAMWRDLDAHSHWQGEIWNRRKGGEVYLEWMSITKFHESSDGPVRYFSVFHDITDLRKADERIRHLAFHDALTNLPNRSLLMNRMDQQIARAEREQLLLAVLFLDLDGFKAVNDNLGHDVGDDLLKEVAQKILAQVRQTDTVARLGGDEFLILLDNPGNEAEVTHIATRILAVINEPMEFRCRTAKVGASMGIAMFPRDGRTSADLIKLADTAMYAAKKAGKNVYRMGASLPCS